MCRCDPGPLVPMSIFKVKIPSDQISLLVVMGGEKASGVPVTTSILHSGLRNPVVPTGTQTYCACDGREDRELN